MRNGRKVGGLVKHLTTEVQLADHAALKAFAQREGRSVQDILRDWLLPLIRSLPQPSRD